MTSIKGHYDGSAIILDEPVTLTLGQHVKVLIDDAPVNDVSRPSLRGIAKGTFAMRDDFSEPLDEFAEYRR